ncbi:MAG: hypothetical protein IJ060_07390 [Oscillospiraceae bacterium]|nr:hypothetical protein [Oscillospiraceae bacterium]
MRIPEIRNRLRKLSVFCVAASLLLSPQDVKNLTAFSAETDETAVTETELTTTLTETETTVTEPAAEPPVPKSASGTVTRGDDGQYSAVIGADDICITVSFGEEANIPENTVVSMTEFVPDTLQYDALYSVSDSTVRQSCSGEDGAEAKLQYARFFDISFLADGEVTEPEGPVSVGFAYTRPMFLSAVESDVIHITEEQAVLMNAETERTPVQADDGAELPLPEDAAQFTDRMQFETDSFSAYGLVFYNMNGAAIGDALDGMSFALLNWDKKEGETGTQQGMPALMAEYKQESRLEIKEVSVYPASKIISDADDFSNYLISDTDVTEWTFTWIGDNDYYITAEVDGVTKYLSLYSYKVKVNGVEGGKIELLDAPDPDGYSVITVQNNGTGNNANKLRLVNKDNWAVNRKGSNNTQGYQTYGPNATSTAWTEWFVPAFVTDAKPDDGSGTLRPQSVYTARKVSASDRENLVQDAEVVVYSKVWNSETNEYENYAIDGNGNLVKVWESGGVVQWIDYENSSLYWQFIEYGDSGYYEFYNPVTGMYLAPQNGQILSNSTIGVTLSGRENGEYTSTLEAWDGNVWSWYGYRYSDDLSLIPAPDTMSAQMCFAVKNTNEAFHPVETVDSKAEGITIRMYDYTSNGDRSAFQTNIIGESTYTGDGEGARTGLVKRILEDGYPVSVRNNLSLEPLFSENASYPEREANHLFLKSTFEETGYFEYSCFDNSAFLVNEDGTGSTPSAEGYDGVTDFTVYQELIAPGTTANKYSYFRGNFLPYNQVADYNTYTRNIYSGGVAKALLSEDNPRYGESINVPPASDVDYFFGMSIDATFMIPENGCDENGNPLIFEFTGDDDFWLFIDDVLVLDLGGIHNALNGKINFQTGEVMTSNGYKYGTYNTTTILDCFRAAGVFPDGEPWDDSRISEYFKNDGSFSGSEGIFKDYSSHTMKIFFMERGAGASNLRLRFNLATVPENSVFLQKNLTGTQTTDYSNTKYAYQLYYKPEGSEDYILYENPANPDDQPHYENQNQKIEYADSVELHGTVYENVYFLRAGEAAEFSMPSKKTEYYFKELSVFNQEYDYVNINSQRVYDSDFAETLVKSYPDVASSADTVTNRKRVVYENHIDSDYLKTLKITKRVVDKDGNPAADDKTGFEFQVNFLDEDGVPVPYRKGEYYVRDSEGYYYVYVDGQLSKHGSEKAVCSISGNNGSIAGIPDGFSVEIENLLPTTAFMVEEQEIKIPLGYQLLGYEAEAGSYNLIPGNDVNYGIIRENSNAHLTVINHKGFGITVNKHWTDQEYTDSHETIHIALFHKEPGNTLKFVEGTLRELVAPNTSIYYFNDEQEANEYLALEVNPDTVQPENWRSDLDAATDCEPYLADTALSLEAQTNGGNTYAYDYVVSYEQGEVGGAGHNIRTDTIVNSRDYLRILKQSAAGDPLYGAVFTLRDLTLDEDMGSFTSDESGLITNAFFTNGHTYELKETAAPKGYQKLSAPLTVTVSADGQMDIAFDAADAALIDVQYENGHKSGTLTVTDKPESLTLRKVDADGNPLKGAVFTLYQFDRANNRKYTTSEYTGLTSDENGVFFGENLRSGYYLLEETSPPNGFAKPDYEIVFHLTLADGAIDRLYAVQYDSENARYNAIGDLPESWIYSDEYGYTLSIPNERILSSITIEKTVDRIDRSNGTPVFMFRITQTKDENGNAVENGATYTRCIAFERGDTGLTKTVIAENLPIGSYMVEELSALHYAPAGLTVTGDSHAIISSYQSATVALHTADGVTVSYQNSLDETEPPGFTAYADNRVQYAGSGGTGE